MLDIILDKMKIILKSLNPSLTLPNDAMMIFAKIAYQDGLSYCNIKELPEEATDTIALMAVSKIADGTGGAVSSISEGGRSVSYATVDISVANSEHRKSLDQFKQMRVI